MSVSAQRYLSVQAITELLNVSKDCVIGWLGRGELRGIDVSRCRGKKRRWRISEDELQKFLQARQPIPTQRIARRQKSEDGIVQYF